MTTAVLSLLWRRHRLAMVLGLCLPVLVGLFVGAVYPELRAQQAALEKIAFVRQLLTSVHLPAVSPLTLLAVPYQHPLTLILFAVLPAVPAVGLLAGERGRGGLDLILSTRLERRTLVTAVGAFILLVLPWAAIAPLGGSAVAASMAGELHRLPVQRFLLAGINASGLLLFWGGVALLVGVLARDRGSASLTLAVAIVVAFSADSAARLAPGAGWLALCTPYGYFRPTDIVGGADTWLADGALLAISGLVLAIVARELEHRRQQV